MRCIFVLFMTLSLPKSFAQPDPDELCTLVALQPMPPGRYRQQEGKNQRHRSVEIDLHRLEDALPAGYAIFSGILFTYRVSLCSNRAGMCHFCPKNGNNSSLKPAAGPKLDSNDPDKCPVSLTSAEGAVNAYNPLPPNPEHSVPGPPASCADVVAYWPHSERIPGRIIANGFEFSLTNCQNTDTKPCDPAGTNKVTYRFLCDPHSLLMPRTGGKIESRPMVPTHEYLFVFGTREACQFQSLDGPESKIAQELDKEADVPIVWSGVTSVYVVLALSALFFGRRGKASTREKAGFGLLSISTLGINVWLFCEGWFVPCIFVNGVYTLCVVVLIKWLAKRSVAAVVPVTTFTPATPATPVTPVTPVVCAPATRALSVSREINQSQTSVADDVPRALVTTGLVRAEKVFNLHSLYVEVILGLGVSFLLVIILLCIVMEWLVNPSLSQSDLELAIYSTHVMFHFLLKRNRDNMKCDISDALHVIMCLLSVYLVCLSFTLCESGNSFITDDVDETCKTGCSTVSGILIALVSIHIDIKDIGAHAAHHHHSGNKACTRVIQALLVLLAAALVTVAVAIIVNSEFSETGQLVEFVIGFPLGFVGILLEFFLEKCTCTCCSCECDYDSIESETTQTRRGSNKIGTRARSQKSAHITERAIMSQEGNLNETTAILSDASETDKFYGSNDANHVVISAALPQKLKIATATSNNAQISKDAKDAKDAKEDKEETENVMFGDASQSDLEFPEDEKNNEIIPLCVNDNENYENVDN